MRPQQEENGERMTKMRENDRMNANDLHCITIYVCRQVASIVLVPQNDPGAGQRCVLNKEKIERK